MTSTNFGDQLAAMVAQYRSRLPGVRRELQSAYEDVIAQPTLTQILSLRHHVHKLAGSGATFGFPAISQDALAFESLLDALIAEFAPPKDALGSTTDPGPHRQVDGQQDHDQKSTQRSHTILRIPEADQMRKACDKLIDTILAAESANASTLAAPDAAAGMLILGIGVDKGLRRRILSSRWLRHQSAKARSFVQWFDNIENVKLTAASEIPQAIILQSTPEAAHMALQKIQEHLEATLAPKSRRPYIIVILHDESSPNGPDTFIELGQSGADRILELPRDDEHLERVLGETLASHSESPYRVIMLDDDQKLCEFYAVSLKRIGVDIVPVADPRTLLATMEAVQPHLLLIDVHLGTHKGLELAASIRQQPRWDGLPLILLSTDTSIAQVTSARRKFADDYLAKPIAPSALYDAILPYLRASSRQRELVEGINNALSNERAEKDKVHQANERMALFLATVTHEIRSPLQGILGIAGLLARTELQEQQAQYLSMMRQAGTTLSALTADILDFSKMESGKLVLSLEPTSLMDICGDLAALNYDAALRNNVTLVFALDPRIAAAPKEQSSPLHLMIDRSRLVQILNNLSANAIRFSAGGLVTLTVSCEPETEAAEARAEAKGSVTHPPQVHRVRISVGDSGKGMSPAQISALFNPYVQVHDGDHYALGGTGLGLTIAKRLVNMMGGDLAVESSVGEGTTFDFVLHMSEAEYPGKALHSKHVAAGRLHLSSPLLVVAGDCTGTANSVRVTHLLDECARISGLDPRTATSEPRWTMSQTMANAGYRQTGSVTSVAANSGTHHPRDGQRDLPSPVKVLVAEDLPINRTYLKALLDEAGCIVTLAEDGAAAVQATKAERFDLIILDCQMPVLDGYAAASTMRTAGVTAPIYALTASSGWNERARCLASGMTDVLGKPMTQETLSLALAKSENPRLTSLASRLMQDSSDASVSGQQGSGVARPEKNGVQVQAMDINLWLSGSQVESLAATSSPDGSNLLASLIPDYTKLAELSLSEVDIGFGARDQERVMRALHRLRGASSNIGAARAAKDCQELEILAGQRQWSDLGSRIPLLRSIVKDSVTLLAQHIPPNLGYTG